MHRERIYASATRLSGLIRLMAPPLESPERDALRETTWAYVDELKARGWSSERIIVNALQLAREGGWLGSGAAAVLSGAMTATDSLLVDVVSWCVERYALVNA